MLQFIVSHFVELWNILSKSILRNLIEKATEIVTLGYNNKTSVNETLDEAESKILNVIKNRKSTEFRSMPEV